MINPKCVKQSQMLVMGTWEGGFQKEDVAPMASGEKFVHEPFKMCMGFAMYFTKYAEPSFF